MTRRILFSAQRNEGPFLLEWLAYHHVVGFEHAVVYSNDCTDGSDDLLDALQDLGVLTHIRHEVAPSSSPQRRAATLARSAQHFHDGDWVMWLDSDEYLLPLVGARTLSEIIDALEFDAMMIGWRRFGDSGQTDWTGRQLTPQFTGAENIAGSTHFGKALLRFGPEILKLSIHRPLVAEGLSQDTYRYLSSSGADVDPRFYLNHGPWHRLKEPAEQLHTYAMVMHFMVRTPGIFASREDRGDGWYPATRRAMVRDQALYDERNRNEGHEDRHLIHEAATVSLMSQWLSHLSVAEAAAQIEGFQWQAL